MSAFSLQQTEKQFQTAVIELARAYGWLVYHTFDSRRSEPGFPDLVMLRGDRAIIAELKTENGKVSAAQERWLDALNRALPDVRCEVWRPSMWREIEGLLAR